MNVKEALMAGAEKSIFLNDIEVDPKTIKAVLINEVVPLDPTDDFYGATDGAYLSTTLPLFQQAGIYVDSAHDLLDLGIYLTNAIKTPKHTTTIEIQTITENLPLLEKELSLFPNIEVIMLMGDVAKKAFNQIAKKQQKKNAIPSVATYKIRQNEIYYGKIRLLPSYIMTGKNVLIEKSKVTMAAEDIAKMYQVITKE